MQRNFIRDVYAMRASVRQSVHIFKLEHLLDNKANRDQILSKALLRRGKGCVWIWARSD